jgi:hypothetical protein
MALPSKVVSLWFWPQLEQALVPSCIQCMDNGLVSNNFLALLSASNFFYFDLLPHRDRTGMDNPKVLGGMGIAILSTSRGIMTDREARLHALVFSKKKILFIVHVELAE